MKSNKQSFLRSRGYTANIINKPFGQLVIYNTTGKKIELDNDLANLVGIRRKLAIRTFVKQIRCPTAYFIHCDLIDKTQNLFNRRSSDLLAVVDVKVRPYEKVTTVLPSRFYASVLPTSLSTASLLVSKPRKMVNSLISRVCHFVLN